jgi:hypothetical protein
MSSNSAQPNVTRDTISESNLAFQMPPSQQTDTQIHMGAEGRGIVRTEKAMTVHVGSLRRDGMQ